MRIMTMRLVLPILISILSCYIVVCQPITVGTGGDYSTLAAAGPNITPGDTVIILNQTFSNGTQFLTNVSGTSGSPIVIIAQSEQVPVFQGGTEGIHLVNCNYLEINGLVFDGQTGNGFNADDGGDYSTPSRFLTFRNCIFRNIAQSGNHDLLKMSGVDDFLVENCQFLNGNSGGAGIDMVGCHDGVIQDNIFDDSGVTGIQAKGGCENVRIQRNTFRNISQRAINAGGSTGLQFFRPPLPNGFTNAYEAANIEIYSNLFIGNWAPIAYVTAEDIRVRNNTFYAPENWVMRILQETTDPGFISCQNNEFSNNIIYQLSDLTEVNIGPNTLPTTFTFTNNLWYNASSTNWSPNLPVTDPNQLIGNPDFADISSEDFKILPGSPAINTGFSFSNPTSDFFDIPFGSPPSRGAFAFDDVPLAIDNLNLRAIATKEGIEMTWQDKNPQQKKVERSIDGSNWIPLGFGNRNTSGNDGIYLDQNPEVGTNFYRLSEEVEPGSMEYSNIIIVIWNGKSIGYQRVFPNPTTSEAHVDLSNLSFGDSEIEVKVYNTYFSIVRSATLKIGPQLTVDLSGLPTGIYILQLETNTQTLTTKVVKQ